MAHHFDPFLRKVVGLVPFVIIVLVEVFLSFIEGRRSVGGLVEGVVVLCFFLDFFMFIFTRCTPEDTERQKFLE